MPRARRSSGWSCLRDDGDEIRFGVAPDCLDQQRSAAAGRRDTLETCLAESKAGRLQRHGDRRQVSDGRRQLAPILKRYGLKLVSGWFSGELLDGSVDAEKARIENQLATFKALGAPVLVYAETTGSVQSKIDVPVSRRPRIPDERFRSYGRKLTALAEHLADRGVALTYHHHMGTIVESRAGDRSADGQHRPGGRAADRHRASHLCGRGCAGRDSASRADASTISTARMCASTC